MSRGNPLFEVELERFRYSGDGEDTLAGIGLSLEAGSLTVIVGDSGSGKSTLGAVLCGMLPRHDGEELEAVFEIQGQTIRHVTGKSVRIDPVGWARHVGMLPQDTRHYLSGVRETVAEELAVGLENSGVPRAQMHARITALAHRLGLGELLDRDPETLSGGQERLVALAALTLGGAPVLILDEPLAGLDASASARVAALLQQLRAEGTALVLLTRAVDGSMDGADHVLRLRAGRCESVSGEQSSIPRNAVSVPDRWHSPRPEVLLEFSAAELGYRGSAGPAVRGLDLLVHAGECVGLVGPNGSGKSTVLKTAAGLLNLRAGVLRQGTKRGAGVGLLLQNPADQLFERTVHREVAFGLPRSAAVKIPEVLESLGLAGTGETHPYELPAAARRLVALATVLVHTPALLLLDEPTEALDAGGLEVLRAVIGKVLDRGGAVLMASHDEGFLSGVAGRIHRMQPVAQAAR